APARRHAARLPLPIHVLNFAWRPPSCRGPSRGESIDTLRATQLALPEECLTALGWIWHDAYHRRRATIEGQKPNARTFRAEARGDCGRVSPMLAEIDMSRHHRGPRWRG